MEDIVLTPYSLECYGKSVEWLGGVVAAAEQFLYELGGGVYRDESIRLNGAKKLFKNSRRRYNRALSAMKRVREGKCFHPENVLFRWQNALSLHWSKVDAAADELEEVCDLIADLESPEVKRLWQDLKDNFVGEDEDREEAEYLEALEAEAKEGGNPYEESPGYYPSRFIPIWDGGTDELCFDQ